MSYAVLVLPNTDLMTMPVLRKLHSLVTAGAAISGCRPKSTPGLTGFPGSQREFDELVFNLWGDLDGVSRTQRSVGKGKVFWGMPLSGILERLIIEPDVEYNEDNENISWIHRRSDDSEIYFIVNRTDTTMDVGMKFRTTGREAEIWDPVTGETAASSYSFTKGMTSVPLHLEERQSVFIVFRNKTDVRSRTIPAVKQGLLSTLAGPWEISFPPNMGTPDKIEAQSLGSWTVSNDEGIKYFSGTAVYRKSFAAPKSWFTDGSRIILDLGKVCDLAEVSVNGQSAGILWDSPFRADITGMLNKGTNTLEIKVTNQWTNRLAGDQKAAPGKKVLNSSLSVFSRGLNDSGLLGPVTILKE